MSVIDLNCKILDFLGISRDCVSVDIAIRINALPVVTIVRYVLPHQIVDDALVTETKRFRLEEIPPEESPVEAGPTA